jgi:hypothetical protein
MNDTPQTRQEPDDLLAEVGWRGLRYVMAIGDMREELSV